MNTKTVNDVEYIVSGSGTFYRAGTKQKIIEVLEEAMLTKERIRIFYGNTDGYVYEDDHDVIGTVGRTTGSVKSPILIHSSRCHGGSAIITNLLVRIDALRNGKIVTIYAQDNIHFPEIEARPFRSLGVDEWGVFYKTTVGCLATFRREEHARHYVAFLRGERWAK